jgi:hypothetical protein
VTFRLANVAGAAPFEIVLGEGRDIDRAILGSFLGRMCADTYPVGGFMASALVVSEATGEPGPGFGRLMAEIGAVRSARPAAVHDYWVRQVALAHEWYAAHELPVVA